MFYDYDDNILYNITIDEQGDVTGWNGHYNVILGNGKHDFNLAVKVARQFNRKIRVINNYEDEISKK